VLQWLILIIYLVIDSLLVFIIELIPKPILFTSQ